MANKTGDHKAHPLFEKKDAQKEAIKQWKSVKKILKDNPNSNIISEKMQEFKLKQSQQKSQSLLFWQKFRKSSAASTSLPKTDEKSEPSPPEGKTIPDTNNEDSTEPTAAKRAKTVQPKNAPAQEKVSEEIKVLKSQFFSMQSLENSGLPLVFSKDMSSLKRKIIEKEKVEKRLISKAQCEKERRRKLKETISKLGQTSEEAAKSLKPFNR